MENLPVYIHIIFGITTLLAVGVFCTASHKPKTTLIVLLLWLTIQTIIGVSGFYTVTNTIPPRFLLMVFPPVLLIIALFASSKGRRYIDNLNTGTLTIIHVIRIPVEIVLFWLFIHKTVPELMTFEGRNFDILSGLTAPLVYYFFIKQRFNSKVVLFWNIICLGLLINIVINAVFSAPFPFQKFAFDQPNIAVLYFPFNWLPSCVVPLVLFSHLASIRQIIKKKKKINN